MPQNPQDRLIAGLPVPELLNAMTARFQQAGIPSPRVESEWLLAAVLQVKRSELYGHRRRVLAPAEQRRLEIFFRRRLQREPLQYILGNCEFYGREFKVSPATLIPRPETELLAEKVIHLARARPAPRIIDLGAGSGCLAVTLALELPQAHIAAVDVSLEALQMARENAHRWQIDDRIEFLQADMCHFEPAIARYDIIVSNPPYVLHAERESLQPEVRDYEPPQALFVGGDGLKFYRCILKFCAAHLQPGGWAACEMASPRHAAIENLFRRSSFFDSMETVHDYAGLPRHIIAQRRLP